MVAHLAGCGHRTIAHIAGPDVNVDAQERLRGYRAALKRELPAAAEYVLRGDFTEESGYRAGRDLLITALRPDAVFAANDMMAIGCLCALTEAGLRVPQDIALAGFDDIPTARFVVPALTTVRVRISDMGGRALDRLATAIENPSQAQAVSETVPAELIIRASCGAPVRPAGNPRSAPVRRV
jgi:LacI family transcriptional regulator